MADGGPSGLPGGPKQRAAHDSALPGGEEGRGTPRGTRCGRRSWLVHSIGVMAAMAVGCPKRDRDNPSPGTPSTDSTSAPAGTTAAAGSGRWKELRFPATARRSMDQLALVLEARDRPLLVALHGRGESLRGLEAGARGWRDDYDLDRADRRLRQPPLVPKDLLDFVRADRLEALNASLAKNAYEGLSVACPFTPDLSDRSLAGARAFAAFVIDELLPRARRELGAPEGRARVGIDGVSLGGRYALLVGLTHPEVFGAVGALQPAIRDNEVEELTTLAHLAEQRGLEHLRLVTSEEDYFRPAVEQLSESLRAAGVRHELLVTPGPHDYVYNRGPGSFEMLLWHERVLRGLPPP